MVRYERPLVEGVLLSRYQRFLAEVRLEDRTVTAHVPNSGSMRGCSEPGSRCRLREAPSPRRRLAWTLEQVFAAEVAVGINTQRANALALEALEGGVLTLPDLRSPWRVDREVRLGEGSRLDFRLVDGAGPMWVEVKNVTWVEGGVALFPDAVTARGARHLGELLRVLRRGERAAVVYVVQRGDARALRVAEEVDPTFARAVAAARGEGLVEAAVVVRVTATGLVPHALLPVVS